MPPLRRKKSAPNDDSTASDGEGVESLEAKMEAIADPVDAKDNIVHKEDNKALLEQIKIDNHLEKIVNRVEKEREKENIPPTPLTKSNMDRFQNMMAENITMPALFVFEKTGCRLGFRLQGFAKEASESQDVQDLINEMVAQYGPKYMTVAPPHYRLLITLAIIAGKVHIANGQRNIVEEHFEDKPEDSSTASPTATELPDSFEDI